MRRIFPPLTYTFKQTTFRTRISELPCWLLAKSRLSPLFRFPHDQHRCGSVAGDLRGDTSKHRMLQIASAHRTHHDQVILAAVGLAQNLVGGVSFVDHGGDRDSSGTERLARLLND